MCFECKDVIHKNNKLLSSMFNNDVINLFYFQVLIYLDSLDPLNIIKKIQKKIAIAKVALNRNININYDKTMKFANYNKRNGAYCRESIEILSNHKACNGIKHYAIDDEWQQILQEKHMHKPRTRKRQVERLL